MIYLASKSPRRRQILRKMGVSFRTVPSKYQERMIPGVDPDNLVMMHAVGKAKRARAPRKARYILGADTIVWCKKRVLGKPKTWMQAWEYLSLIAGRMHFVYTGVAIWDRKTDRVYQNFMRTRVHIKKMSDQQIEAYYKVVNPFDKAGAYAIQEGPRIIEKIDGSYSNVMGLPVELVRSLFAKAHRDRTKPS